MKTMQRIIRRADLPIEYSKGFNPHMSISIAQPLSVGMYSVGDYMDVVLTEDFSEIYVKDKFNENVPSGVKILEVCRVKPREDRKVPQAMALIDAAKYVINIKYDNTSALKEEIERLLKQDQWVTIKKSKKTGEKEVNIKPMVKEFKYDITAEGLKIEALVSCGSKENLSAELLSNYITEYTSNAKKDAFVDIKREEMYVNDKKLIPLYKYVK